MQQLVDDKLQIAVPFLGGVNELVEVFDLPNEEFKSSTGVFPQFNGMLARCPGKVAIRYETSPIRSIHQSFSGGSFCFYVESDRLLLYNECENPRYTVKPETPADLGTDDDGFTLDVFGGEGNVPLNPPNLSFSPKCVPQGDAPTPDPDPGGGGDLNGEFLIIMAGLPIHEAGNPSVAITVTEVQIDYVYEDNSVVQGSVTYVQGVDFDTGNVGSFMDFTAEVATKLLNGSSPLFAFRFFEVSASPRKPILCAVLSTDPFGEMTQGNYGPPLPPANLPANQIFHLAPYAADWPDISMTGYWT